MYAGPCQSRTQFLEVEVAHTGFEPVISFLRGRCPRPLDECAPNNYITNCSPISQYLNSLTCHNGKLKFYSCLRALSNWLHRNGYIPDNPIKKVSLLYKQVNGGLNSISLLPLKIYSARYTRSLKFDDTLRLYRSPEAISKAW